MANDLAQVTVHASGGVWKVGITGEVDMSNAQAVAEEMREAIPNHAECVVLDLTHTSYLDSRGISLLFQLARRMHMRGLRMAIAVPEEAPIRAVLNLTGVSSVATIYPTVDEARSGLIVLDN